MSKKSPQLRFKGFTDAWEELKLGDAVSISSGVTGDAALQDGKYRLTRIESISQGMLNVARLGFTNEKPDQKYLLNLGDILYSNINSLSHIGKVALVDTTGIYHGINLLRFQMRNGVDSEFLFQRLNTMPMKNWAVSHANPAVSQASINQTELSKQPISSPTLTEQQQIGNFFKEIDNIIGLHQRKLDLLKEQKKGYLQKMFPKAGEKIPELRFAGFADDWEERKLGEFVIDYVEKTTTQNQFPVLTSSQQQGIVLQETYFANRQVTTDNNIGYYVLPRGYFTFRNRSDNDVFIFNRNDIIDKGIISYFYPVFTLKNSDSDFFLKRVNNGIKRQVSIQAEGTGQHVLSMKKFKNIISMFPSLEEQEKIGSFFKQLDNTIALHQRKLDLLKEQKKGFLQKMFV